MDKQRRVLIPQKLRDFLKFQTETEYALCLEEDKIFYIIPSSQVDKDIVIDIITLDMKGRFPFQAKFIEKYQLKEGSEEFVFVQKKRAYISFAE